MTNNVSFKVCLHRHKETVFHRFSGRYSLAELQTVVSHLWGGIEASVLSFEYQDAEGDMVRLGCALEWDEALRLWAEERPTLAERVLRPMRIVVRRGGKKERKPTEVLGAGDSHISTESEECPLLTAAPTVPKLSLPSGDLLPPTSEVQQETSSVQQQQFGQPSRRESSDPEMVSVVDLLSKLYNCDAAESLYAGEEGRFNGVVTRVQQGDEVHLDIDRYALYQHATRQANAALDAKDYNRAEEIYRFALGTYENNNILEYNLACSLSLQGKVDDALAHLSLAIDHGYDNHRHMTRDADLAALHGLPGFSVLCGVAAPQQPQTIMSPRPQILHSVAPSEEIEVEKKTSITSITNPAPPASVRSRSTVVVSAPAQVVVTTPAVSSAAQSLMAVFPSMTVERAEEELRRSAGNLQVTVNRLLSEV